MRVPPSQFAQLRLCFPKSARGAVSSLLSLASVFLVFAFRSAEQAHAQSNEWVWMGGSSTVPGANAGQPGVYGTLGTAAAGNIPGARDNASTWTDSDGNLWVFGGNSVDPSGLGTLLNDLWKFDPTTNQWTWISGGEGNDTSSYYAGVYGTMGVPAVGNTPGGRENAATWIDKSGNLWLFGGYGTQSWGYLNNPLSDLWEFNPSTSLWTWMGGSGPVTFSLSAVYGTLGTPADANFPGARQGATTWTDSSGNFWLFGGIQYLNDLWRYNPSTNQWTWMNGSSSFGPADCYATYNYTLCGVPGVFGTLGTPAAGNTPGGSQYGSAWTDSSGNFWLFGGYGADSRGLFGDLNNLWEFNPSTDEWTWMGGSQLGPFDKGTPAEYGSLGTFAASNLPGGRNGAASWTDSSGNFWLFGGNGLDVSAVVTATGGSGDLNDLWEYSPSKGYWAWMGGSNSVGTTGGGQPGVYGTLGTAAAGNVPGGRDYFASVTDKSGNFWLFGGAGYDSADTPGFLNDVWEYQHPTGATTTLSPAPAPTFSEPTGTYVDTQTFTISDTAPGAKIYYTVGIFGGTTPTINSPVYNDAFTVPDLGFPQTIQAFATAPGYAPSAVATVVYTLTVPVETAVATPTFTPVAGTYSSGQTVTISDTTPGAIIYYTTDGTTPTTNPTMSETTTISVYVSGSGIPITSTGTVQAIAAATNYFNSAVASGTFTIAPPVASPIGNWAWMGGSSTIPNTESGQPGVYGTLGTPAAGNIPGGRDNAAIWTDQNGNVWLLGGFGYDANGATLSELNDLWEFNPATNQWAWMGGSKTAPTCTGQCGQAGVYGTKGTPAAANTPGGRDSAETWIDKRGNLWLFGGYAFDANGAFGFLNDLWEFNPSTKLWAWMGGSNSVGSDCLGTAPFQTCGQPGVPGKLGTPAAGNIPGGRVGAATWADSSGNLWLFGGYGFDSTGTTNYLNDVWELNTSTLQWTWMGGSTVGVGGGQPGVYGTLGTASAANIPGGRALASTWTDSSGHLWLFGGTVPAVTPQTEDFNDLWEFNPATDQWTWMGGSDTIGSNCALQYEASYPICGQLGVYGTLGSPATGNIPGGRSGAPSWIDSNGNLWLYGGTGIDVGGGAGLLDDLWSFNPSTKQWTWMGGSNLIGSNCVLGFTNSCGEPAVYGTLGSPAVANIPGGRDLTAHWTDSSGHFWLLGGVGVDANGSHIGLLNDVWEYQPAGTVVTNPAAATPTFSVQGGNYSSTQSVTISDTTPNPTIYYTTNGTTPNTSSAIYDGTAITVSSTETIQAIATASGFTQSATAIATYTITAPAKTTPTVTVSPSPSSITTAQGLSVTVTVSGTPTPTGSVVLTSGGYTSGATTLSGGSATINVPAGSLAKGTDTLTATYTPDAASTATYTNAVGTNSETVTAAATAPTVTVSPSPASITTAQGLTVTVTVSGTPTPTGSVVLTSGSYTSAATTLSSGGATINVPAGSLAKGTDTLTATYTPDAASTATYTNAVGTNSETVTAAATAPTVTVSPSPASITTVQGLTVTVTVSGTPTPTGSVVLTSGSYASGPTTLSGGSATINVPAGSLAKGTDTLTATYTPDAASSSTYNSAAGTNTETVTAVATAPTVMVTPSPASITTAQGLTVTVTVGGTPTPTGSVVLSGGGYTSAATTMSSGSATINIPAGLLSTGTDTLTATYTPDSNSSSTYASATGMSTVTVTAAVVTAPVASLTPPSLTFTSTTGITTAAQTATLTNTGNAALTIASIAVTGTNAADFAETSTCGSSLAAGANCTISVTFTPASATSFSATLAVTDNAAGSPQSVTLGGTGTAPPTFTVSSLTPTGTTSQTTAAIYTITITPQNGSFTSPITFTTNGLPAGYTATFNPTTITPGGSPASTTLTIQSNPITLTQTLPLATPVLGLLGLCFLPGKRRRRLLAMCVLAVASLGAVATLSSCGGGFALVKPAQTYTVTITASGGGQTQTTTVLLTVQE